MTTPIKITEVNRPLTCEEHDQNIDAVLDRANHTGTQNCDTIDETSFNACVAATPKVQELDTDQDDIEARLTSVELSLQGGGQIQQDLQDVRQELLDEIAVVAGEINDIELRVTTLEGDFVTLSNTVTSLGNTLVSNTNTLQTQINTLLSEVGFNDDDILLLQTQVGQLLIDLPAEASTRGAQDVILQGNITAEEGLRIAGDNNIINNIITPNEVARDLEQQTQNQRLDNLEFDFPAADAVVDQRITDEVAVINQRIDDLETTVNNVIQPGMIMIWTGQTIPTGWLFCNGDTYSTAAYPDLAAVLQDNFGGTLGSTFVVPDLRNRVPYGFNTGPNGIISSANYFGLNTISLAASQIPSHAHSVTIPDHVHSVDITHNHTLGVRNHGHTAAGGDHFHDLVVPGYQQFGENAGAGSFTDISMIIDESNPPDIGFSLPPRTASAANTVSVAINSSQIFPAGEAFAGGPSGSGNRTDLVTATPNTSVAGGGTYGTTIIGSANPIDIRQAALGVKFIIKT